MLEAGVKVVGDAGDLFVDEFFDGGGKAILELLDDGWDGGGETLLDLSLYEGGKF